MKPRSLALCLFLLALPALAQLDGQLAIEFKAADGRFSSEISALPECAAHLVPVGDLDSELSYPCGELFVPPRGRYIHWVEGLNRISPDHLILNYAGGPFGGRTMSIVRATVPAGLVRFTSVPANPDLGIRLLHVDSHVFSDRLFYEFFRRLPAARAMEGKRLPEGHAVALLYDNEKQEYVAVGRPFAVKGGAETRIPPPAAPTLTTVFAILGRVEEIESPSEDDLEPALVVDGRRLEPDLRFGDPARVYAVWYEVKGSTARLELASQRWRIEETEISLRPGKVETLRPTLKSRPQLKVEVQRPASWLDQEVHLLLVAPGASSKKPIEERVVPPAERAAVFAAIPPQKLEVELRMGPFSMRQEIDASDGIDHEILFDPQPIELSGQVFVGDDPRAGAELTFHLNRLQALPEARSDLLRVMTDAEGCYTATLFSPGWVPITVVLPDRQSLPFQIFPRSYIEKSGVLDFVLPGNHFTVEVVDRKSGHGVPKAEVEFESSYGEALSFVTSIGDRTDEQGRLDLPPIRVGRLDLRVRGAGFEEASRTVEIGDLDLGRPIRIELEGLPEGEVVALRLASGGPAQLAEAALFYNTADSSLPWWQGHADERGHLELPRERQGSVLLIRHPAAGGLVIEASTLPDRLLLPARAPDLLVEVHDKGGAPAPTTALAFRLGGFEVAGRALSFLIGNPLPATDHSGAFRATGLPAGRLEVLAWAAGLDGPALNGLLSNFATTVDPAKVRGALELTRIE